MKILLLIDSLASGGKERRLIELIKGFQSYQNIDLNLVVFSDNVHYTEVFEFGFPVTLLKRVPKRNPRVFYQLFKLCKKWQPDLIHSWGTMSTIIAIPSVVMLNIKLINGNIANAPRDMSFFDSRLIRARLTYPFSSVIIGNSEAGLKAYNVPKKKARCIYNGFDLNRIEDLKREVKIREGLGISSPYVVGMVGRFFDQKDYHSYISAALEIVEKRDDIIFLSIGEGPNLKKIRAMVPAKYSDRFLFTGVRRDVESIINIFTIGVLSTNSNSHGEGISNAILEYMILEKPVIATTGGGTNEIIKDGETGILIPAFSPHIMANKIMYLIDNPDERKRMGKNGKKRIKTKFSLNQMTKSYYELYENLLTEK